MLSTSRLVRSAVAGRSLAAAVRNIQSVPAVTNLHDVIDGGCTPSADGSWGTTAAVSALLAAAAVSGSCGNALCNSTAPGESGIPRGLHEVTPSASGMGASNEHTVQWRIYTDRGAGLMKEGKYGEAEQLFRRALREAVEGFGDGTPHVAAAMNNLAQCLWQRKKYSEAEPLYLKSAAILEEAFGNEDPRVAQAYRSLVPLYLSTKQLAKAQRSAEKALAILVSSLGKNHPLVVSGMFLLAEIYLLQGQAEDAIALQLEGMELTESLGELNTRNGISRLKRTAMTLAKLSRCSEADVLLARSFQILEQQAEPDSPALAITAMLRGAVVQWNGKLEAAEECFRRARSIYMTRLGPRSSQAIGASLCLLEVQLERGAMGRAKSTSQTVTASAREAWVQATDPPSGLSIGNWSFSWNSSGPPKKDTDKLMAALQYAQALRLTARQHQHTLPAEEVLGAAGNCLEEAYLVIESSVRIHREIKGQAWHDFENGKGDVIGQKVLAIMEMQSVMSQTQLQALLLAEVYTVRSSIRILLETTKPQTATNDDTPAAKEVMELRQRLEEILELGD
ncbi:uncharacterized protein LOC142357988 [Convolutriloba macropyga]|uniref:uncharacterized protein LOC142357988 n=1 Tax=Convolutriloba macropyga TaxID=536237 RepID=UPI003F521B43